MHKSTKAPIRKIAAVTPYANGFTGLFERKAERARIAAKEVENPANTKLRRSGL
jgi:hypothetical protein